MDARKKSIEIGELNSCNAQPLEKSENIEVDNRQPDPFQESSSFEESTQEKNLDAFVRHKLN